MSDEIGAKIRKYTHDIRICGMGVIVLSLWNGFKFFLTFYFGEKTFREVIGLEDDLGSLETMFVYVFFCMFFAIFLIFLCSLGISAIRYSVGKKKRWGFLIIVAIMGVLNIISIPQYFISDAQEALDTKIASILIDITTAYIYFDMVYAAIKVKKLKRVLGKE